MSEIRLVRCPKCDKVLPEPSEHPVYQCGGCGAVLRAKKKLPVTEKLSEGSGEEKLVTSGGISEEAAFLGEGNLDMASVSPARSTMGGDYGSKSPTKEGDLTEFDGALAKSPMRDRFLNDVAKSPLGSRNVSRSPMRERGVSGDFDVGVGNSLVRSRNVSKSPIRGRTPVSMRTRGVSGSPLREGTSLRDSDVDRSPARSMNGDIPKSPLRGLVSEFEGNVEGEQENMGKMTPKASFNSWLSDEINTGQSNDSYTRRRRRTWRDQVDDRADQISEGRESVYSNEHGETSQGLVDEAIYGTDPSKERIHRDGRFRGEYAGGYVRPRTTVDPWVNERDRVGVSLGTSKVAVKRGIISASSSVLDGPSNYRPDSSYEYVDSRHGSESLRGPASVQNLQLERIQLRQKYRDLKDQLSDMNSHGVSSHRSHRPDDSSEDGSLIFRRGSMQQYPPDRNLLRPSHFDQGPGLAHDRADHYNIYHPVSNDAFAGQVRRGPRSNRSQFPNHSMSGYVPGRSLDFDQALLESYRNDTRGHHPACACSLCYADGWQARDLPLDSRMAHERHDLRAYDSRMAHTAPRERPPRLGHHHLRRVEVASLDKRLCRPISSGAPFVLCQSCFQLLKLPAKLMAKQKNQLQLQCGACSTVMPFDIQNRSFGPFPSQKKPDSIEGFGEVMIESGPKHGRDSFGYATANVGSYDFDAVEYSFPSKNSEASRASKGQKFGPNSAENTLALSSSPSRSSKNEHISDTASVRSSQPNSSEMPKIIRPPPGSPLRDHLDYSSVFHMSEAGSIVSYSEEEKQVLEKNASSEGPLGTMDATETEIPSNELPKTSSSQESWDLSAEGPTDGNNKDVQPSVSSFVRGILSGSGRGSLGGEVYVNGQTILHRLVKKAEKLAGPIQPGDYWYDPKAGFWGVMGHRCLGIIPPVIQEFSFPMLEDCSRGDTAVYINGRELHKKDLNLLASRGLPTTRNKRYMVDISGKVLDEENREFIVNLGKLAPTVERNKCGFGMQVPEELND